MLVEVASLEADDLEVLHATDDGWASVVDHPVTFGLNARLEESQKMVTWIQPDRF